VKRRSGCGCGSSLALVAVVIVLAIAIHIASDRIDRWRFPWAYPDMGQPSLGGTWVGPMTTGGGRRLGMLLELEMAPLNRGRRRGALIRTRRNRWFEGRVLVCGAANRIQRFTLYGAPDDTKNGSRFHLSMSPADSVPPDGLSPSHLKGRWNGGDSLDLSVSLYLRKGKSAISSTADPDTGPDARATLRHGTDADFTSLCTKSGN
jgi:hypothetical protein